LDVRQLPSTVARAPRSIPRLARPALVAPTSTPRSDRGGPSWRRYDPRSVSWGR